MSRQKEFNMLFAEKIKQLREELGLPQRHLAAELQIDTATYCKIERGDRKANRSQVILIAKVLSADENELLTLWLADKVKDVVGGEKELAGDVLEIVRKTEKY